MYFASEISHLPFAFEKKIPLTATIGRYSTHVGSWVKWNWDTSLFLWKDHNVTCSKFSISLFWNKQKKWLRKGNVFSRVCLSTEVGMGGSHVTITHDALDLSLQGPHPFQIWDLTFQVPLALTPLYTWDILMQGPQPLANDIQWPSLETCSNLFTLGPHTGTDI